MNEGRPLHGLSARVRCTSTVAGRLPAALYEAAGELFRADPTQLRTRRGHELGGAQRRTAARVDGVQ